MSTRLAEGQSRSVEPQAEASEPGENTRQLTPLIDKETGDISIDGIRIITKAQLGELGVTPQTAVELFKEAQPGLEQLLQQNTLKPDESQKAKSSPEKPSQPPIVYSSREDVPSDVKEIPIGARIKGRNVAWNGSMWRLD